MEEKVSLLKRLDLLIFQKIDQFKKSPSYSQIQDLYSSLEEEQQKVAKILMVLVAIALPFLLVFTFWLVNNIHYNNLDFRKKIVSKSQDILRQQNKVNSLSLSLISDSPVDSQNSMNSLLLDALGGTGMDLSKVKVTSFNSTEIGGNMSKSESDINFESLSNEQLMDLFMNLYTRAKVKVSSLNIEKNQTSQLLNGQFHVIHFSTKLNQEE
jgi:hypothetical protein